ncbi:hypothetical protein Tco_1268499 [Tanacetum coccineum]
MNNSLQVNRCEKCPQLKFTSSQELLEHTMLLHGAGSEKEKGEEVEQRGIATVQSDYPRREARLAAAIEGGNIWDIAWEHIPMDTLKEQKVVEYPHRPITTGADLSPQVKNQLVQLLGRQPQRLRIGTLTHDRRPKELAKHNLSLNQYATPIRQKRQSFSRERPWTLKSLT